ncbi:MAG: DUF992 domain-containing protein [Proteobacteria bacterium]|nr:DUF992 domain-containing protein [Pseudomonadota bacterium]
MTKKFLVACVAAAAIGAAAGFATPADAAGVKVGVLTCHVSSGWGFVFGSSKDLNCSYSPKKKGGRGEHYVGTVSKYGVDIGYTESAVIVWAVVAPTSDLKPGALEGNYAGVSASATLGYGVGANALLGGFDKSIALQPLSIEGNKGLNVAAGIGAITLKSTP